jgi:hypothetical protein
MRRNYAWVLPSVAIVLMVVVVFGLSGLVSSQHNAQLEACTRGNESRVATVRNLRADEVKAKKELRKEELVEQRYPLGVRSDYIAYLRWYVDSKAETIRQTIHSQREVAIEPGSPVVDCHLAYP